MATCINIDVLRRFAKGELSPEELSGVEAHLEACIRCARCLDELPEVQEVVQEVKELEASKKELEGSLHLLKTVEEQVTTTLYGGKIAGEMLQ